MVTMRRTTWPISRHSERCRVRLPSNRIRATASDTSGNSNGPNSASGCSQPSRGPARMPQSSRNRIAGRRRRQASHWLASAAAPMPPRPSRMCDSLIRTPCRWWGGRGCGRLARLSPGKQPHDARSRPPPDRPLSRCPVAGKRPLAAHAGGLSQRSRAFPYLVAGARRCPRAGRARQHSRSPRLAPGAGLQGALRRRACFPDCAASTATCYAMA